MKINSIQKAKKISNDFICNVIASIILTGMMQVVVYPYFAKQYSNEIYGFFITVIGLVNTITTTLGTSLNNTRLIMNNDYLHVGTNGDFNFILLLINIITAPIVIFVALFYFKYGYLMSLLISLLTLIMINKAYYIVDFRLNLNFVNVLKCNILGAIGYLVGLSLIRIIHVEEYWPIVFILSEGMSMCFILNKTTLTSEPFSNTILFFKTLKKYIIIIFSTGFGSVMTYFDRFFLYPLMGSEAVTTYTISSFFGKSLSIVMLPISNVLLGYYAQKDYRMTKRKFMSTFFIVLLISTVFFVISLFFSPFITAFLYPNQVAESIKYMPFANLAAILSIGCMMLQTAILKFAPTYYQIIKEFIYAIVYIASGFIFCNMFGLVGFCYSAIFANLIKLLIIFIMGWISLNDF